MYSSVTAEEKEAYCGFSVLDDTGDYMARCYLQVKSHNEMSTVLKNQRTKTLKVLKPFEKNDRQLGTTSSNVVNNFMHS